jgi:hypothetical protein
MVLVSTAGHAQAPADPRIGLGAGLRDAGSAARHMEVVASLSKPEAFVARRAPAPDTPPTSAPAAERPSTRKPNLDLSFANTDLAFAGDHLFSGNFHGFNVYNVEDPRRPRLVTSVVCPGGQGDLSVYGHLLFMSVEQARGRLDCGTGGVQGRVSPDRFRGVRIFDVSDVRRPRQLAAVQTCRGSHTHTLVVDPDDAANVYIYGSGTGSVRSAEELAGCSRLKPEEDPETALFSIDIIQVPLAAPETARIVNRPRIFADPATGALAGLWKGGTHGPGTQTTSATDQCHDITVMPAVGLAAGACSGNGILLDISDPVRPLRLDQTIDPNFAYWHSATFNNDGTKVIFTDEWGGGTQPRCRATDNPAWGANAIFDIVDRRLRFRSYYKMPAAQTEQENCVAHNGSIVPVPGRDIMVQGWYQGGVSVFDFTDSAHPVEIAFFDRGPVSADQLVIGGFWAAYWHAGYVFGAEMARGVDVLRLTPSEHLSQNEIAAAALVRLNEFNPQHQPKVAWPNTAVVARAYLDQLARGGSIDAARRAAVSVAAARLDSLSAGRTPPADLARAVEALISELDADAGRADEPAARRFRLLAATLRGRLAELGAR